MARILELKVKIDGKDVENLSVSFNRLSNASANSYRIMSNLVSRGISEVLGLAGRLANEIQDLATESIKLAANYQGTTNALAVFTGSISSARRELAAMDEIALNTTGLRLESAEQGYERLRALRFEADLASKFIKGIANQKLLSNADEAAVGRVIVNLTQIKATSKDANRDLKEMIKAIPSLSGVFEDTFGTSSTSELRKILQANPKAFFDKFATGLANAEQAQGGLNEAVAKGGDAFIDLGRTLGEPILEPLTKDIRDFTEYIRENKKEVGEWGEYIANVYKGASTAFRESRGEAAGGSFVRRAALASATWGLSEATSQAFGMLETLGRNKNFEENLQGGFAKQISQAMTDVAKEQKAKQREADRERIEQAEQTHKSLLENFKMFKDERLSIIESLYKVEDSRLKSHLDYTTEQELRTAKEVANNQRNGIRTQIAEIEDYYNKLLKYGNLDTEENIKFGREKNAALAKLNAELKANEFNTQKEILEFEKKIQDGRQQAAIELKNLQIKESQFGYDNQIFDAQRALSNQLVSAKDGFDKLIDLTQKSYSETSRFTRESYELQLQDLSLTKERRFNLTTEMYQAEQDLAEKNRRAILQIEDEKFQKSIDLFKEQTEQIIKLGQQRGQLFKQLQGGFFQNSINFGDGWKDFGRGVFELNDEIKLNENLNSVLSGKTSIYQAQKDLMEKYHKSEIANLERQFSLNTALIDLEKVRLTGDKRSEIADLESRSTQLLEARARALQTADENGRIAAKNYGILYNGVIEQLNKAKSELKELEDTPADKLNNPGIRAIQNKTAELKAAKTALDLSQAGEKQNLFQNSTEGLKQLYAEINSGQKNAIIGQIQENAIWNEKVNIISEIKSLEQGYYKDSTLWAERRKLALLQFDKEVFEAEQNSITSIALAQKELAQKSIYSANQANASVLDFLNQNTKTMSQIVADGKIGIIQNFWGGLETSIDKVTSKLGAFGGVLKQILLDLVKMATSKIFSQIFGGSSGATSSGGGNWFSNLWGGIRSVFNIGGGGSGIGTPSFNPNAPSFFNFGGGSNQFSGAPLSTSSAGIGGRNPFAIDFGFGGNRSSSSSSGSGNRFGATQGLALAGIGASIIGSLIGDNRAGRFFSGAGSGIGLGMAIGSIVPGIGTLAGGIVGGIVGAISSLFSNPQRKRDKNEKLPALNKVFTDALAELRALGSNKTQFYADPAGAMAKALELRAVIASGGGISFESSKYRKESQKLIAQNLTEADRIIADLSKLKDRAMRAKEIDSQLQTSFAGGVYMDSPFINQFRDFKRRNGKLQGNWTGKDTIPAMLAAGELVLNPMQQARAIAAAGFDVFKYSQVPNYAGGTFVAPTFSAPSIPTFQTNAQPIQAQTINFNGNIVLEGFIALPDSKAFLETPDGKRQVIKIISNELKISNGGGLAEDVSSALKKVR